jgi:hypothetical protein
MALMPHEGENLTSGWCWRNIRAKIATADERGRILGRKMEQRVCAEEYLGELANGSRYGEQGCY